MFSSEEGLVTRWTSVLYWCRPVTWSFCCCVDLWPGPVFHVMNVSSLSTRLIYIGHRSSFSQQHHLQWNRQMTLSFFMSLWFIYLMCCLILVAFFFSTRVTCPNYPVAMAITEMLQSDMPCWSRGIFYVLCLLFGRYSAETSHLPKNVLINWFCTSIWRNCSTNLPNRQFRQLTTTPSERKQCMWLAGLPTTPRSPHFYPVTCRQNRASWFTRALKKSSF